MLMPGNMKDGQLGYCIISLPSLGISGIFLSYIICGQKVASDGFRCLKHAIS